MWVEAADVIVTAIAAGETEARDILAAVTPGGAKSLLPVIAAARLIAAGVVERMCWVVPRESLRLQAEEAFGDPVWRSALGHVLSVRAADNQPDPSRGLSGYIMTYQAIAAAPDLHLAEFRRFRTLLVVDEVHHLPALAQIDPTAAAQVEQGAEDVASAWSRCKADGSVGSNQIAARAKDPDGLLLARDRRTRGFLRPLRKCHIHCFEGW